MPKNMVLLLMNDTSAGGIKIVRELARGIYTTVYEARHTLDKLGDRPLALKVFHQGCDPEHFLPAVRLQASLRHPRIPTLHQFWESAGHFHMVRQFVDGDNLQTGIGAADRSLPEIAHIVAEVAAALDYAHARGVVHGLVHPRHVLLGNDGAAWLIGFGEWPPLDSMAPGNPLHLAPEQLEGDGGATPASDVYALAETALWLLTGRHPFAGTYFSELRAAKRAERLRQSVRDTRSHVCRAAQQALLRALASDPADRYPTAGEFATALASAAGLGERRRRWWFW